MQNQIPKNWQKVRLGEIAVINMGQSPSSAFYNVQGEGLPFYQGVTDFGEKYPTPSMYCSQPAKIAEPGTALFSVRAPVGEVNIANEEACIGRGVASISMINSNNDFLYFFLKNQEGYFKAISGGTTYESINKDQIEDVEVVVPTDSEDQKKVASVLSAFDDKIEVNNKIAKTLEEIAQALFKEWFVKFKFPGYEKAEFVDIELGKIPKGWHTGKLSDIAVIIMGQSPSSEFYNQRGEGLPFHQGVTNFGDRFLTHEIYCTQNNRVAEKGDILFSVRAPVGRLNIVDTKISLGRGVTGIRQKNNCQSYLYYLLKRLFRKEDSLGGGSVFPSVTKDDMEGMKILIPNEEVIKKFENIVNVMDMKIELIENENQILAVLRDLLLPKLMKGEIRV